MIKNIVGVPTEGSVLQVKQAVDAAAVRQKESIVAAVKPRVSTVIATYGASILLAGGSTPLEGMKRLIVRNRGNNLIWIGDTSSAAIYEGGISLEPGEEIYFEFTGESAPSLYARSSGYSSELEVIEA